MNKRTMLGLMLSFAFINAFAVNGNARTEPEDSFLAVFWNVENFFDTHDDPDTNDEEFTYNGAKKWYKSRYNRKANDIARTILAIGDKYGELPSIIGFAEVENRKVLTHLLNNTLLSKLDYGYVHYDSPDTRGIDVALIYDRKALTVWDSRPHTVRLPEKGKKTRDILHVTAYSHELHRKVNIFVNHWPSKLEGAEASMPNRMAASNTLKHLADSLSAIGEYIIITGDFNDTPDSEPICSLCSGEDLVNLTYELHLQNKGTLKYKGRWELIDQFIVSSHPAYEYSVSIFKAPYLLEEDRSYLGNKPRRTYLGPYYHGGVSDHLPLVLRIY